MFLSLLITSLMALPPMDKDMRTGMASDIVTVKVDALFTRTVDVKWGTDTAYVIQATVTASEKGDLKVGRVIYVHAQQTGKRPDGWTGPQGQNRIPDAGATATLYLRATPDGVLTALSPNGID